jgi:hypothetical protein
MLRPGAFEPCFVADTHRVTGRERRAAAVKHSVQRTSRVSAGPPLLEPSLLLLGDFMGVFSLAPMLLLWEPSRVGPVGNSAGHCHELYPLC